VRALTVGLVVYAATMAGGAQSAPVVSVTGGQIRGTRVGGTFYGALWLTKHYRLGMTVR